MKTKLNRRLLPLYAAAFLQGFILYYTVDKLLASSVGLSATGIALSVGIMSIVTVLAEVPSGVMADRWSRKGVLYISQTFLALSTVLGAYATSGWHYTIYAAAWGIFFAMYSGIYEAITYDLLIEEQGDAKNFARIYGRVGQLDGAALMAGALIGAVIADRSGVHAPFFWTLPIIVLGYVAISLFREPTVHKAHSEETKLLAHARQTLAAVRRSDVLKSLFLVSAVIGGSLRLLWEFNQLWHINLGLPIALFGIANALIFTSLIIRGWLVPRLKTERFRLLSLFIIAGILTGSLLLVPNAYVAAAGIAIVMLCILSAELVLKILQQDRLPSRLRAGATSVLSTISHLVAIPVFMIFGSLVDRFGISKAGLFVLVMFALALVFAVQAQEKSKSEQAAGGRI